MATLTDEIRKGFDKADALIKTALLNMMSEFAYECIKDTQNQKEFMGFTGQTQTSYMAGVFHNGKLVGTVDNTYTKKPVFRKLRMGESKYLKHPYEGKPRAAKGYVWTDGGEGRDTSVAFLRSYKGVPKKGWAVVVTTGTEYSEYIESVRRLNVLTNTAAFADVIFDSVAKEIV